MSISSKQDALLRSGFLGKLGSNDRGDSLSLNNSARTLVSMAENLITEAQKNLNKSASIATGELEASMSVENLAIDGSSLSVDVMILDRYKFINDGVKGVNGGRGKYRFKTTKPSKGMVDSVKKWLRQGKKKTSSTTFGYGKTEKKNRKLPQDSMAWAVATNVKKNGIKPTLFFTKAIKSTERKWKKELAKGFKLDIIESLKDGAKS